MRVGCPGFGKGERHEERTGYLGENAGQRGLPRRPRLSDLVVQRSGRGPHRAAVEGRTHHQAKDLLRASQTHLLDKDNPQVEAELKKIKKGKKLSPVLLVRGDGRNNVTLTIADGQHRICGSWYWDEDCPVACCVANLH